MGSHASRFALAILLTVAVAGCQRGGPTQETESQTDESTGQPSEETPEADEEIEVQPVEIVDEGPAAPVILFTAGLKGYTEPCGCTLDLVLGGIDRVTGYIRGFDELNERTLVLDAGNLLFEHDSLRESEHAQEVRKTQVLIQAVGRAGTFATTPGPTDFAAGVSFYREVLGETEIQVLSANLATTEGEGLGPSFATAPLGELTIGVVGAADPTGFEGLDGIVASPAMEPIGSAVEAARGAGAEVVVLLWQGDLASARVQLRDLTNVDFIIIGQPRDTDEIVRVGSAHTLEAYDQGRKVGRLKLVFGEGDEWTNARGGSDEEIARLERVIGGIEEQLEGVPETEETPPIVLRQRERIADLQAELEAMQSATVDFAQPRTFLFRPISMEPGLPVDPPMTEAMETYNAALQEINAATTEPPARVAAGLPYYAGVEECARCHSAAVEFWETTSHAHAWDTLIDRGKEWDRSCVGCHTTGYGEPGGSTLGHTDGLINVQCEQCHGPGSMHVSRPSLREPPTGVMRETTEQTCVGCHNEEHSTTFDYETYLPRILGPGHGM